MSSIKRALVFSVLTQQGNLLISLISIAVIARLLTPTEIGIFSVTSVVFVIATEIRSFGTNQYIIREKELSELKLRTALGVMMVSCWSISSIIFFAAPSVATFYAEPDIEQLLRILSFSIVVAPFASVNYAQMLREMEFDSILNIRLLASFWRAFSSIALILYGLSYFGLAWGVLIGSIIELVAILYFTKHKLVNKPSLKLWRDIMGVGAYTSGSGLLQRIELSIPDIVLGKISTMENVGLFSRGFGLIGFIDKLLTVAVKPLILPYLSKIKRDQGSNQKAYIRCIVLHSAVAMPAFACASAISLPLINLFFGSQWEAAAPVASILAGWAILKTTHNFLSDVLIANGHEKILATKHTALVIFMFLAITIGARNGLEVTAYAFFACSIFDFVISAAITRHFISIPLKTQARAIFPNVIISLAVFFVSEFTFQSIGATYSSFAVVLVTGSFATLTWLLTLRLLNHDLLPIIINTTKLGLSKIK